LSPLNTKKPALIIEYTDPEQGFKGWFIRDKLTYRMCAGGLRVQNGLTMENLITLARNMTLKMCSAGLGVDGAKCGIDYNPNSPGKYQAVERFITAIRPQILENFSIGPDLNTEMAELEKIAAAQNIPSIKMAIAKARGWDISYFIERYQLLNENINGWPLGKQRAGYCLAMAVLAVLDFLRIPANQATIAIQGFGGLAKAAAWQLTNSGVTIVAIADEKKCLSCSTGLDSTKLLAETNNRLPDSIITGNVTKQSPKAICSIPCDILIPAAIEKGLTGKQAGTVKTRAVVPGANMAVTDKAASILHNKGIIVIPDFIAGSGGSLAMESLFGPDSHPAPATVLEQAGKKMRQLIQSILQKSTHEKISPIEAALDNCRQKQRPPLSDPYAQVNKSA
jgi:glutamate dehydrogenase (NAD(P)+)